MVMQKNEGKEPKKQREWMKLQFESHSWNESFARVTVAAFLARLDPTVEEMEDVKTAVSEAVTNAVVHGYENGIGVITVETDLDGDLVTVKIHDEGCGIADIKQAMEPLYTGKPELERSGMGFSFMEAFMDEVEVESAPGQGTTVTMKKRFREENETRDDNEKEMTETVHNEKNGK